MTKGSCLRPRRVPGQPVGSAVVYLLVAMEQAERHRTAQALNSGASAPAGTQEAVERLAGFGSGFRRSRR